MNDTPTIAPMGDLPENEPTENSTLDELAAYALLKQDRIIARDKMNGEDLWLMGRALEWAFQKTPYGEWEQWWKAKGFKKTYVWQARKLYEHAATLEEMKNLGPTEALLKFGVVAEKKPQAGTKAAGGKNNKDEDAEAVPASDKKAETPTDAPEPSEDAEEPTDDGGDPVQDGDEASDDLADPDERPSDDLADEEEKEFKEFEASIRKLTPKTRAIVIHHALELLRDELNGEVDPELQQTLGQIARLAEELKGMNSHDEHDS